MKGKIENKGYFDTGKKVLLLEMVKGYKGS